MQFKAISSFLIISIALVNPFQSLGQNANIPPAQKMLMHHETPGDAYLPNAYKNKKTSPPYRYINNGAPKTAISSIIFTNQVNVDATGQNILGDAGNETSIAVNPLNPNIMAIGWRQFDNVFSNFRQAGWGYTINGGQTWTFPGVLEPGTFRSDPVLDFDSAGNFYYNSLTNTPDYFCKVFQSTNGGAAWDAGTDAAGGDKQWMAIDRTAGVGSGNIYSTWTPAFSTCIPDFFTRSTDGNNSYEPCTYVEGEPFWSTMAVNNAGELYIGGGSSFVADSLIVVKSVNAQVPGSLISWNSVMVFMDGFLSAQLSVNPAGLLGQVNIDVDQSGGAGNGNVYLLASLSRISNSDPGDVMFAKSTDGGLTWSPPLRINDDISPTNTQWFGTMSVAPNGRIDAVWLDNREDLSGVDSSALYHSYSIDQGNSWSANDKLSALFDPHVGYPMQNKMGDYFDMVSHNSGAHLAWANTLNGEQDVYYSYIIPQTGTEVNEFAGISAFSIFPNPTNGVFAISGTANQSLIEIYTVPGVKVYSKSISKTKNRIDISNQPAGIYFVKIVMNDGSVMIKKIIKN